jgi:hypothetical protein
MFRERMMQMMEIAMAASADGGADNLAGSTPMSAG